jgi:hypothetical protein
MIYEKGAIRLQRRPGSGVIGEAGCDPAVLDRTPAAFGKPLEASGSFRGNAENFRDVREALLFLRKNSQYPLTIFSGSVILESE